MDPKGSSPGLSFPSFLDSNGVSNGDGEAAVRIVPPLVTLLRSWLFSSEVEDEVGGVAEGGEVDSGAEVEGDEAEAEAEVEAEAEAEAEAEVEAEDDNGLLK